MISYFLTRTNFFGPPHPEHILQPIQLAMLYSYSYINLHGYRFCNEVAQLFLTYTSSSCRVRIIFRGGVRLAAQLRLRTTGKTAARGFHTTNPTSCLLAVHVFCCHGKPLEGRGQLTERAREGQFSWPLTSDWPNTANIANQKS